jgi:predicted TIM-barrel enzyme
MFARQAILDKLRAKVASGKPIVGGGAGTGISAKMSEAGGIDTKSRVLLSKLTNCHLFERGLSAGVSLDTPQMDP